MKTSHGKRNKEVKRLVPYFAMYNACFFAQIFEGKIRMHIIHGYNDYIPWYNSIILFIMHTKMWAHIIHGNI